MSTVGEGGMECPRCRGAVRVYPLTTLRSAVVLLLAVSVLSGCLSRDAAFMEVRRSRMESYDLWRGRRSSEERRQPRVEGKLSLEDALKLGLQYNRGLEVALADQYGARGRLVEAYSEALPSLDLGASYRRRDKLGGFTAAGVTVTFGELDNYSLDLTVTQPLFKGGKAAAGLRAARLFMAFTDEVVRGVMEQVVFDICEAHYEVLLSQHLEEISRDAAEAAAAHLEDVKRKRAQGVASDFDVLRAQVELSNFRAEQIRAQSRIHLAMTSLLRAMGVSQESEVELSDELVYRPFKPVFEEAVRTAYLNRPDLSQAELEVRLRTEAVKIALSKYFPTVSASFFQTLARPDPHETMQHFGYLWEGSITASFSIFDGLAREGQLMQERANLRRSKINLSDTEEKALFELQSALLSLRDAEQFVESQKLNQKHAAEGLRLASIGYREGVNTEVEVIDARAAYTRARANFYQAVHGHVIARLFFMKAIGLLGSEVGSTKFRTLPEPVARELIGQDEKEPETEKKER